MLDACPADLRVPLTVLAFTGMRVGELVHLRPADMDAEHGWVHIVPHDGWTPKTGRGRKVPIHRILQPLLMARLRSQKPRKPRLFTAAPSVRYPAGDHPLNPKHLNDRLQKVARKLGYPVGRKHDGFVVHSLRHFFETHCHHAGVPQRAIDTWLGHTGDKSMGSLYYRLRDPDSQRFMKQVDFAHPTHDNDKETA